ncbi:MAG: hypothetical protein JXR58_05815, partial [Bacteroidales bacterium]|nr:hypothetical protein [Bacteroidales bacterium]
MNKELNKVEIRSEEVQEILGHIPPKIIRSGIGVILISLVIIIGGTAFFHYPEILQSEIVITTKNPPINILAKQSGKIQEIFVNDADTIEKGTVLGIIENTSNTKDFFFLKNQVKEIETFVYSFDTSKLLIYNKFPELGELQTPYLNFVSAITEYLNFFELDYFNNKIDGINSQVQDFSVYYGQLIKQKGILEKQIQISNKQFLRDSLLLQKGVLVEGDIEKSSQSYYQTLLSYENAKTQLANTIMQINTLKQTVPDLELQSLETLKKLQMQVRETYQTLLSSIKQWENKYLLVAPERGIVSFTGIWNINQNIASGDNVFTIVPLEK